LKALSAASADVDQGYNRFSESLSENLRLFDEMAAVSMRMKENG